MNKSRFTDEELAFINATFADNDLAIGVLRKMFLFETSPEQPLGGLADMWTTLDLSNLSAEDRVLAVTARQMLITHLERGIVGFTTIAGNKTESVEAIKKRLKIDSSK